MLRDDEQRTLDEIEHRLTAEEPWLARQLTVPRRYGTVPDVVLVAAVAALMATGLVLVLVGMRTASPLLIVLGGTVGMCLPAPIGWRLLRRR